MRKIIFVPIIHMDVDLGSLSSDVSKKGRLGFGEEVWKRHEETISGFWDTLIRYFEGMEAAGFRIYQDGMVADGEVGEKIVEDGVKSGSKNYMIVQKLIRSGAVLMKTEDFGLVKEERDRLVKITKSSTAPGKLTSFLIYKFRKKGLLRKRDSFIAESINKTLSDGETGILFVGAYHDVIPMLDSDIEVKAVKDVEKIRGYQRAFLLSRRDMTGFEKLSEYLIASVE